MKISGHAMLVLAITAAGLLLVFFWGEQYEHSLLHRVLIVLLIASVLAWFGPLTRAAIRFTVRHAPQRRQFSRDPAARADDKVFDEEPATRRVDEIKAYLRDRYGWRWLWSGLYRDRWLLVCGDTAGIDLLAPGLRRDGWLPLPEEVAGRGAILLYGGKSGSSKGGDIPDIGWLKRIGGLRRRRPVDAMVAVVSSGLDGSFVGDTSLLSHQLHLQSSALGWAAPCYLLNPSEMNTLALDDPAEHGDSERASEAQAIACMWSGRRANVMATEPQFQELSRRLALRGVERLKEHVQRSALVQLSANLNARSHALAETIQGLRNSRARRNTVHGWLFAPWRTTPVTAANSADADAAWHQSMLHPWQLVHWQTISLHSRLTRGSRIGFSWSHALAWLLVFGLSLWMAGSLLAGGYNRAMIAEAAQRVTRIQGEPRPVPAAIELDALQKQIDTLEVRQREGAPWTSRFALNRDGALLAALWPHYQSASRRILSEPLALQIQDKLLQRSAMSMQELNDAGEAQVKASYADLKAYLMLTRPQQTDTAFLKSYWQDSGQPVMTTQSLITPGGWRDLSRRLIGFHVDHLKAHGQWAMAEDRSLINATRESLVAVIGLQHSVDALYQSIIADNAAHYPALSLQTLLGGKSSRGLFSTNATVPGIYTRVAWDERIGKRIDDAEKQGAQGHDWVLFESAQHTAAVQSPDAGSELRTALRERYFADYARAWELFLNSLQWQPDQTLSGTIDQLTLLADAQRSPLIALFSAVSYQAGAGTQRRSFSDNLVNKAQELLKGSDADAVRGLPAEMDAPPLASAFASLLRLHNVAATGVAVGAGQHTAAPGGAAQNSEMSLARYLERVTAVRLKLQQIMASPDPDAMSRATAQAILQGRTSDVAESRDYANRVGASLGQQWNGFGNAVFSRPLEQTWGVLLRPAAVSLNENWRSTIVAAWNTSFSGRYPFVDSDNDASLAELSRFLRSDGGLISQFVSTQLAGMLERQGDQWQAIQGAGSTVLSLDPQFIAALNRLTRISNRLFAQGDAGIRFELKPVGNSGVTDLTLKSGAQSLQYFNEKEEWLPMSWPGDALNGASHLAWRTEKSGLRADLHADGRFGLIRLLSQAQVTQLDGARYVLSWKSESDDPQAVALRILLRSEAGGGPLDVLALRNFVLPQQIFLAPRAAAESVQMRKEIPGRQSLSL